MTGKSPYEEGYELGRAAVRMASEPSSLGQLHEAIRAEIAYLPMGEGAEWQVSTSLSPEMGGVRVEYKWRQYSLTQMISDLDLIHAPINVIAQEAFRKAYAQMYERMREDLKLNDPLFNNEQQKRYDELDEQAKYDMRAASQDPIFQAEAKRASIKAEVRKGMRQRSPYAPPMTA